LRRRRLNLDLAISKTQVSAGGPAADLGAVCFQPFDPFAVLQFLLHNLELFPNLKALRMSALFFILDLLMQVIDPGDLSFSQNSVGISHCSALQSSSQGRRRTQT